ncbi:hypothetical protein CsatB_006769 [Cannabis sativa]
MDSVSILAREPRCMDALMDACEHDSAGVVRETEVCTRHTVARKVSPLLLGWL